MNVHSTSTQAMPGGPAGRLGRNILVVAAGGIVVATAVAGSLWLRGGGRESAPTPAYKAAVQPSLSAPLVPARHPDTPHTVYIVASQAQADWVATNLSEANAIRNNVGETPLFDTVVVAGSDAEAAAVVNAMDESNRLLAAERFSENRVVDLRYSVPGASAGAAETGRHLGPGAGSTTSIYIVGSEAEATDLRNAVSLPGSTSEVLVVGSRDEANYAADFFRGLNPALEATNQPSFTVTILGALASQ